VNALGLAAGHQARTPVEGTTAQQEQAISAVILRKVSVIIGPRSPPRPRRRPAGEQRKSRCWRSPHLPHRITDIGDYMLARPLTRRSGPRRVRSARRTGFKTAAVLYGNDDGSPRPLRRDEESVGRETVTLVDTRPSPSRDRDFSAQLTAIKQEPDILVVSGAGRQRRRHRGASAAARYAGPILAATDSQPAFIKNAGPPEGALSALLDPASTAPPTTLQGADAEGRNPDSSPPQATRAC